MGYNGETTPLSPALETVTALREDVNIGFGADPAKFNRLRPTNQAGSRFVFQLKDDDKIIAVHTLLINPESIQYNFPSRTTVDQTIGGATIDDFGLGIQSIRIRGTTGWGVRFKPKEQLKQSKPSVQVGTGASTSGQVDGYTAFRFLKFRIYEAYHLRREARRKNGTDPNKVVITFTDGSTGLTQEVHMENFILQRNNRRPLLFQYDIPMMVTKAETDAKVASTFDEFEDFVGKAGPTPLIMQRLDAINGDTDFITENFGETLGGAASSIKDAVGFVRDMVSLGEESVGIVEDVLSNTANIVEEITKSVQNVQRFLNENRNLVDTIAAANRLISGAYELRCVVCNFRFKPNLPNLNLVHGSKNCGSTLGIPLSKFEGTSNTFESINGAGSGVEITNAVVLDTGGRDSQTLLNSVDSSVDGYAGADFDPEEELNNVLAGFNVDTDFELINYVSDLGIDKNNFKPTPSSKLEPTFVGESIVDFAQRVLGNATRWQEIALLNGLRYPYLSNDILDVRGNPVAALTLSLPVAVNDTVITVADVKTVVPSQSLIFDDTRNTFEVTVLTVDEDLNIITVDTPIPFAYTVLTSITVFEEEENITTNVAKPGSALRIPVETSTSRSISNPSQVSAKPQSPSARYDESLGIDLRIDPVTKDIIIVDGDAGITKDGVENLVQALNTRMDTELGELAHHTDYGVTANIGANNTPEELRLTSFTLRSGLLLDPRVRDMVRFEAQSKLDRISIVADIKLDDSTILEGVSFVTGVV